MITAQILSIVALAIAWVWWVSFAIGLIALVLLQIIWCCRMSKAGIIAAHAIAVVASLACFFAGIFLIVERKDAGWCDVFTLEQGGYYNGYGSDDYCPEKIWAGISFVDAILWLATAHFTIMFLRTGRYDKWEAKFRPVGSNNDDDTRDAAAVATVVEMGNTDTAVVPVEPKTEEASDAAPAPTATVVPETNVAAVVPPETTGTIEEA